MSVVIKNVHGQYWTGKCWGVKQAAETFETVDNFPEIEGLELVNGWGDEAYYYPENDGLDMEPFASFEKVR